ncbi:MAG: hypothetical protein CSB47_10375 [Proteobacteria bacterium]|nr:MAG: hypothetical protein CSB47_10375 [Pseudomonadota bacterium]
MTNPKAVTTQCFTSNSGMKVVRLEQPVREKKQAPQTRQNQGKVLSQSFPSASTAKLLAKYNNYETKAEKAAQVQTTKARRVAGKILAKKKTALAVLNSLHSESIDPAPIVVILSHVANNVVPGKTVTVKDLHDIAGSKPAGVSDRWWKEGFPLLLDITGITVKSSKTERRFAELCELENRCFMMLAICQKTGDIAFDQFDRLGGKLINTDPFTERAKDGSLIVHERPHQTAEGKEAARRVFQARYLKKMKALEAKASPSDADFSGERLGLIELLKTYKMVSFVALIAVFLIIGAIAEGINKSEINPLVHEQGEVLDIDAIANQDEEFGYLSDE